MRRLRLCITCLRHTLATATPTWHRPHRLHRAVTGFWTLSYLLTMSFLSLACKRTRNMRAGSRWSTLPSERLISSTPLIGQFHFRMTSNMAKSTMPSGRNRNPYPAQRIGTVFFMHLPRLSEGSSSTGSGELQCSSNRKYEKNEGFNQPLTEPHLLTAICNLTLHVRACSCPVFTPPKS